METVEDTPVGITVGFDVVSGSPTLVVAETPVNPITSAGAKDPTFDVAETPVSPITSAGANDPTDVVPHTAVAISNGS